MNEQSDSVVTPVLDWQFKLGIFLFILSIIVPVAGILMVSSLDLSTTKTASVTGGLLIIGDLIGFIAIAVMGKPGYLYIKNWIFSFLKQYGPPQRVSRSRYYIGLVMFCIPILFGWLSIYVSDYIPGFSQNALLYAIIGDLLLIVSLFVLGGDFWDKIRALFVYDADARFL